MAQIIQLDFTKMNTGVIDIGAVRQSCRSEFVLTKNRVSCF